VYNVYFYLMIFALFAVLRDLFREVSASVTASDSPHRRLACLVLITEACFYSAGFVYFVVNIVEIYT